MTRINVGVKPKELTNKHLLAEHREIKRIPNCIKNGKFSMKGQPEIFTLGTGHVKFFYDKIGYLRKRYLLLYNECINRGFNVTNFINAFDEIPIQYMNDYTPTKNDRNIILNRIQEKLNATN